jgi:hypothetical protein
MVYALTSLYILTAYRSRLSLSVTFIFIGLLLWLDGTEWRSGKSSSSGWGTYTPFFLYELSHVFGGWNN